MKEWEAYAAIASIAVVWIFVVSTLVVFGYLLYSGQVDLFWPFKIAVILGLLYWVFVSIDRLLVAESGGIGKLMEFLSLGFSIATATYTVFFLHLFQFERIVNFSEGWGISYAYIISSAVILFGLVILTYYTFKG